MLSILFCLSSTLLTAQQQPSRPPLVLDLPASVRSAGLGGAGVAIIGDAGSVFSNPAGLSTIKYLSLEGAYHRYPDQTFHAVAAVGIRLGQLDFGAGGNYLRFSDTASVRTNLLWVGTAVYRFGFLAVGASGEYLSMEDSTGAVRRAAGGDMGIAMALFDISAIGFSVQNLASHHISGGRLAVPTRYRLGLMLNFVDPQTTARLMGTIETIWTDGQNHRTVIALEAGAVVSGVGLVARIGYGAQPPSTSQEKMAYGGGIVLGRLGIDYAYQQRGGLGGEVHRIGVRWTP